jgi:hypothetical protein
MSSRRGEFRTTVRTGFMNDEMAGHARVRTLHALHNARPHLHYDSSKSGRFSVIKSAANSRQALYLQAHLGTPMDP